LSHQLGQTDTRHHQANGERDDRKHESFSDELSGETTRAGAEGCAHGEFLIALEGVGKLESTHIRRGDDEQQHDSAEERDERGAHGARGVVLQSEHLKARRRVVARILAHEPRGDGRELSARRLGSHARLEPADHTKVSAGAAGIPERGLIAEHAPDVGTRLQNIVEARAHHACDAHLALAEVDESTDQTGVSRESRSPEAMREHHHAISRLIVARGIEICAQHRPDPERPEVRPGDPESPEVPGAPVSPHWLGVMRPWNVFISASTSATSASDPAAIWSK